MTRPERCWSTSVAREQQAYKFLVHEIHRRGLNRGDKLPPQQELRRSYGFSNSTLSSAMHRLVADGVITRSPTGTVIVAPEAADMSAWNIALLMNWSQGQPPSPFYVLSIQFLQHCLTAAGCRCRVYIRLHHTPHTPDYLNNYENLVGDLKSGLIDGIVSVGTLNLEECKRLSADGIRVCFSTIWQDAPSGSVIDMASFARHGVEALVASGATRLGIVTAHYGSGYDAFQLEARSTWGHCARGIVRQIDVQLPGLEGGRQAAEALLQLPEAERPDALLVLDDVLALGLAQVLKQNSDFAPLLAVMTHQAAPLAFALPVLHFELNNGQLAESAATILLEHLRHPDLKDEVAWIAPRLMDDLPSNLPKHADLVSAST